MVSTVCLTDSLRCKKGLLEELVAIHAQALPQDEKRIKARRAQLPYIASRSSSLLNKFIEGVEEIESHK
jgi:hypothetical protein